MWEDANDQEINVVHEEDNDVAIFDCDNWDSYKIQSQKELKNQKDYDEDMMKQIQGEIQSSKENFYKVQIKAKKSKAQKPKSKSLKKIDSLIHSNKNGILKQGWMEKKTDGFFFKWHKRYMALTPEKLFIFENSQKEKVIGCVNFKLMSVNLKEEEEDLLTLDFMGESENLILKSAPEQKEEWKVYMQQVINYHKKTDKVMIQTMVKPLYQFKNSISEEQFMNTSETGDILLFKTKNTGAKIQRALTNSQYDHVAMVVKFKKKQLMVFESNFNFGVSAFTWKNYIRCFDLYEQVTIRKLNYIKKEEAHQILLNFVKKNLGKKYEISAAKLLKFETDLNWDEINREKERGYFCSELIAKALKSLGLIEGKVSSSRFWPVDFSEKNGLMLKKGAWLGPEQTIILKKHLKNVL